MNAITHMHEAKRSGSEKRKRQHQVNVRFSETEHTELARRADAIGLSVGAFIRMQSLDLPPPRSSRVPPINRQMVAQLLAQIGKIGSNVNQIARLTNSGEHPFEWQFKEAHHAIIEMRDACIKALGRDP